MRFKQKHSYLKMSWIMILEVIQFKLRTRRSVILFCHAYMEKCEHGAEADGVLPEHLSWTAIGNL